jgi:hypothetical protein
MRDPVGEKINHGSPIVEIVKSLVREKLGGPVIEIRIELMDDRLKAKNGEETC